jgi:hypothetical protein
MLMALSRMILRCHYFLPITQESQSYQPTCSGDGYNILVIGLRQCSIRLRTVSGPRLPDVQAQSDGLHIQSVRMDGTPAQ